MNKEVEKKLNEILAQPAVEKKNKRPLEKKKNNIASRERSPFFYIFINTFIYNNIFICANIRGERCEE